MTTNEPKSTSIENYEHIVNFSDLPIEFLQDLIGQVDGVDYCGGMSDEDAEIHPLSIEEMAKHPEDFPCVEGLDLEKVKEKLWCSVTFTPTYIFGMRD